jgi:putative ABC transport system permease protein
VLTGWLKDVKFALRMMAKSPWFTAVAVVTLALGIGVNTAGFSIVNGIWWDRLPFQSPQEVVTLSVSNNPADTDFGEMSYLEFADIRAGAKSFNAIAAVRKTAILMSSKENSSERYAGAWISPNLFALVGVQPIRGRDFTPADEKWGQPTAVLISHSLWQRKFGGQEDVVGRAIRVDAAAATIVGIMPPGFKFPMNEDIWIPIRPWGGEHRADRNLNVFGRLADGVGIQQARTEVSEIVQAMARDHADTNKGYDAVVLTLNASVMGQEEKTVLWMLLGAVGFILLIACANAANLLLSRAAQRSREVSVRTALGASRWRIIRQVLIESVMMSMLGGILGLLIAEAGVRWFVYVFASINETLPFWITLDMDYRAFAYFFGICVVTGIGFGSVPAWQISRTNVNENLKEGALQTTGGLRSRRTATLLLVGEIALTVMLLAEAGLLVRGFVSLTQLEIGVDTRNLITAKLDIPYYSAYGKDPERQALLETFVERFQRPDRPTSFAWAAPLGGASTDWLKLQDRDVADETGKLPFARALQVGKDYFHALNVKMTRGRDFDARDGRPGAQVAIVNERFASRYWPSENPLGKRLRLGGENAPWLTVIGVSPDIFQTGGLTSGPVPIVYQPYRQGSVGTGVALLMRSAQTQATVTQLREELAKIDPDLVPYDVMTFDETLRLEFAGPRIAGTLFGGLSVMALIMASVGLYGVTAHGVNQRRREIGIRTALGASRFRVIWMVLKQSLPRIVAGLAIGLFGADLLSDLTKIVLVDGVQPGDSLTFLSTSAILAVVAIVAVLIPAWRAARLNPSDALRSE